MGDQIKKWWLFGYMPWTTGQKPSQYGTPDRKYRPLIFGIWYLYSSRCPVTGVWM